MAVMGKGDEKLKPIDFYETTGGKTAGFIEHMQKRFPKYGPSANTMCNRGDEYGVCLSPKAIRYLTGKPESERRTRPCQYTYRLLEADGEAFTRIRLKKGQTVQQATEEAIMLYIAAGANDG